MHRFKVVALKAIAFADNLNQHLILFPPHRGGYQHATIGQLIQQFAGNFHRGGCRYDDAIEGPSFWPAHTTIRMFKQDIAHV